jgi:hypothetical protein
MKKLLVSLLILSLIGSVSYAKKDMKGKPVTKPMKAKEMHMEKAPEKAKTVKELKHISAKKEEALEAEVAKKKGAEKEVAKNQNRLRLAVHNLLAMKDILGGIGPKVSEIARNLNNSSKKTIELETKIKKKGRFSKFFTGGDRDSAKMLKKEVEKEHEWVVALKDLTNKVQTGIEAKEKLEEQVKTIEEEVNRLGEIAEEEMEKMGIFGK